LQKEIEKRQELAPRRNLSDNLKSALKEARADLNSKEKELTDLKKSLRYTKMNELTEELHQYKNECMRLTNMVNELINQKKGSTEQNNIEEAIKWYRQKNAEKDRQVQEIINEEKAKTLTMSNDLEYYKSRSEEQEKQIEELKSQLAKATETPQRDLFDDESFESEKSQVDQELLDSFLKKIQVFLKVKSYEVSSWLEKTGIKTKSILCLGDIKSAFKLEGVPVNDREIQVLISKFGENKEQILESVLEEELKKACEKWNKRPAKLDESSHSDEFPEESPQLQPPKPPEALFEIIEELQTRIAYFNHTSLEEALNSCLVEQNYNLDSLVSLLSNGLLYLENSSQRYSLAAYLLGNFLSISRFTLQSTLVSMLKDWKPLPSENYQSLVRENLGEILERLKELDTLNSQELDLRTVAQVLEEYGVEKTWAKVSIYSIEESMKKINYKLALNKITSEAEDSEEEAVVHKAFSEEEEPREEISSEASESFNVD